MIPDRSLVAETGHVQVEVVAAACSHAACTDSGAGVQKAVEDAERLQEIEHIESKKWQGVAAAQTEHPGSPVRRSLDRP